jgi:hypothetical protein
MKPDQSCPSAASNQFPQMYVAVAESFTSRARVASYEVPETVPKVRIVTITGFDIPEIDLILAGDSQKPDEAEELPACSAAPLNFGLTDPVRVEQCPERWPSSYAQHPQAQGVWPFDDFGISRRWLWYQIRSFVVQTAKADEAAGTAQFAHRDLTVKGSLAAFNK